jgi:hypothetical protein
VLQVLQRRVPALNRPYQWRRLVIIGDVAAVAWLAKFEGEAIGCSAANHETPEMNSLVVQ